MTFPKDQIDELRPLGSELSAFDEAGTTYFLISNLALPDGKSRVDVLLCPSTRDGYPSRLFFASKVPTKTSQNWTVHGVRIGTKNWHAMSWRVSPNLRLAQMVAAHLGALK